MQRGVGLADGAVLRIDGNTVLRVPGWTVDAGYTSKTGRALVTEEPSLAVRQLFGAAPRGLGG